MSKKISSINENKVFKRVYHTGRSQVNSSLVTYVKKNHLLFPRMGITVSKKIGKAHQRNRAKRIIREAFRSIVKENPLIVQKGYDIIFVARGKTTKIKMNKVKDVMLDHLNKENLLG